MALRKLYLAIECANDAQKDSVQKILNELSNARVLTGERIVAAYPLYKQRENELRQLFSMVANGGIKSLMSIQGASLLAKLTRK